MSLQLAITDILFKQSSQHSQRSVNFRWQANILVLQPWTNLHLYYMVLRIMSWAFACDILQLFPTHGHGALLKSSGSKLEFCSLSNLNARCNSLFLESA